MSQSLPLYTSKYTWQRIFAGLIDYIIGFLIVITTSSIFSTLIKSNETKTLIFAGVMWIISTIFLDFLLFVLYPWKFNGQTIGKHIFKIKIVGRDGNRPDIMTLISRRFIQSIVFIFFPFLVIVFLFQRDKQNLWDFVSSTYVVNKKVDSLPAEMLPKERPLDAPSTLAYRYGALFFDNLLVINTLILITAVIFMLPQGMRQKFLNEFAIVLVLMYLGFGYILRTIYEIISYKTKGQTLGKSIFGTKIVNFKTKENLSTFKITLREFLKFIFYSLIGQILQVILLVEIIKVLLDPERRSFLDKVAGSQVINVKNGKKYPGRYLAALMYFSFLLATILGMLLLGRYTEELKEKDAVESQEELLNSTISPTPILTITPVQDFTPTSETEPTPTISPTSQANVTPTIGTGTSGTDFIYSPQQRGDKIIDIKDKGANGRNYLTINDQEIGLENIYSAQWCKDTDKIIFNTGRGDAILNRYSYNTDIWITDLSGNATKLFDYGEFPNAANFSCDKGILVYGTKNKLGKINIDGSDNKVLAEFPVANTRSEFFAVPNILAIEDKHILAELPDENGNYTEWRIAIDGSGNEIITGE